VTMPTWTCLCWWTPHKLRQITDGYNKPSSSLANNFWHWWNVGGGMTSSSIESTAFSSSSSSSFPRSLLSEDTFSSSFSWDVVPLYVSHEYQGLFHFLNWLIGLTCNHTQRTGLQFIAGVRFCVTSFVFQSQRFQKLKDVVTHNYY
jgi:hypothetical protein